MLAYTLDACAIRPYNAVLSGAVTSSKVNRTLIKTTTRTSIYKLRESFPNSMKTRFSREIIVRRNCYKSLLRNRYSTKKTLYATKFTILND